MRATRYDNLNLENILNSDTDPSVSDQLPNDKVVREDQTTPADELEEIKKANSLTQDDLIQPDYDDSYINILETSDSLSDNSVARESLLKLIEFSKYSSLNRLSFLTDTLNYKIFKVSQEDRDNDPDTAELIDKKEINIAINTTADEIFNMFKTDIRIMSSLLEQSKNVLIERQSEINKIKDDVSKRLNKVLTRGELILEGKYLSQVIGSFASVSKIVPEKGIDYEDVLVTVTNFLNLSFPKLTNEDNNYLKTLNNINTQDLSSIRSFILKRLQEDPINIVFKERISISPISLLDFSVQNSIGYIEIDTDNNLVKKRYETNIDFTDIYIDGKELANSITDLEKNIIKAIDALNSKIELLEIYTLKYKNISNDLENITIQNLNNNLSRDFIITLSYLNIYYIDFIKERIVDILTAELILMTLLNLLEK